MTGYSWLYKWVEQYLFFPTIFQRLIGILLLPLTVIYCVVVALKRARAKPIDFGIPIISIGNLIIGGSGKTPITIALASSKENVAVILRGYGRHSQGLQVVSNKKDILVDINTSGDEAMILAKALQNAIVIVSENRIEAIQKAMQLGAKVIFLDDGFSQNNIKKFDVIIRPEIEPTNIFCLPTGGYRETKMMYSFVDVVLKEEVDFKRIVTFKYNNKLVEKLPEKTILVTAISKPTRLLNFLPKNIELVSYPDHYYYTTDDIKNIQIKYPNYTIITTEKDYVKLEQFAIKNLYIMDLEIKIEQKYIDKIDAYINKSV